MSQKSGFLGSVRSGDLVQVLRFHWLVYAELKAAGAAAARSTAATAAVASGLHDDDLRSAAAVAAAAYWAERLGCRVGVLPENSIFVILDKDHTGFLKIASTCGLVGWIIIPGWVSNELSLTQNR